MVRTGIDRLSGMPSKYGVDVHCKYGIVEMRKNAVDGAALVLSWRTFAWSVEGSGIRNHHAVDVDAIAEYAFVLVGGVGVFSLSGTSSAVRLGSPHFSGFADYHDAGLEGLDRSIGVHPVDVPCHSTVGVDVVGIRCRCWIFPDNSLRLERVRLLGGQAVWILCVSKGAAQKHQR